MAVAQRLLDHKVTDVPVEALKRFARSLRGNDLVWYEAGKVYTLPANIAASFAKQGKVKLVEQETPKPKKKSKKKEPEDGDN